MSGLQRSKNADSTDRKDEFNWQLANRSSCGICLEAFDSSTVIPRVMPCGHSLCETCISKGLIGGTMKCICQKISTVGDVKRLLINEALIDISDFLNAQSSKQTTKKCAECRKILDLCWLALCKETSCNKKLVCLSCAHKNHRSHDYVEYKHFMIGVRADCHNKLLKLQQQRTEKLMKAADLSSEISGKLKKQAQAYFIDNKQWKMMLGQSVAVTDEQESTELVEIAASFLDSMDEDLENVISGLERLLMFEAEIEQRGKGLTPTTNYLGHLTKFYFKKAVALKLTEILLAVIIFVLATCSDRSSIAATWIVSITFVTVTMIVILLLGYCVLLCFSRYILHNERFRELLLISDFVLYGCSSVTYFIAIWLMVHLSLGGQGSAIFGAVFCFVLTVIFLFETWVKAKACKENDDPQTTIVNGENTQEALIV